MIWKPRLLRKNNIRRADLRAAPCNANMRLTENALGAGDQSGNLLWRLETGGEFPTIHMPKTVVILIGTNDLTYADCHDDQQDILNAAPGIITRRVPLSSP